MTPQKTYVILCVLRVTEPTLDTPGTQISSSPSLRDITIEARRMVGERYEIPITLINGPNGMWKFPSKPWFRLGGV
jgi:hypothetical protein